MISPSPDLRIRLEGKVEALEGALAELEEALRLARQRDFTLAAKVLSRGVPQLDPRGDLGLKELLSRSTSVRVELVREVKARLQALHMPAIDPVRGATWLSQEEVLYEHHRVSLAFLYRSLHLAAFLIGLPTAVATLLGVPLAGLIAGLGFFLLALRRSGWSEVLLTSRRMVLEDRVVELAGLQRVVMVRPFCQFLPLSWEVELHYRGSASPRIATLGHASTQLRYALQKAGIDTGNDWGPW